MTSDVIQPDGIREVAVIGLGLMGSGIAELVARSGRRVVAIEVSQDFLDQGMARLGASLDRAVSRGKLTDTGRAEIMARIRPSSDIETGVADADLVIEAIPERMELKGILFAKLDAACRADTILATNTSSLSITGIAGGTRYPARVAGLHFFNPAPVMKLVEVISTVLTSPQTAEALTLLARDLGKTPVPVSDRAGFIVNALLVPYLNHAVRLLETAQATREDIDKAATAGLGLPMGPLTLLDLIGLDTSLSVLEVLQAEFGGTRYAPAPLLRKLCDARLFGRKSGRGFYDYRHSTPEAPGGDHALAPVPDRDRPDQRPRRPARRAGRPDRGGRHQGRAAALSRTPPWSSWRPTPGTGSWTRPWPRATPPMWPVSTSPAQATASPGSPNWSCPTSPRRARRPRRLRSRPRIGLNAVTSRDRPGFLTEALAYAQFNDAVRMFQDGYASPADIDTAMMLGCGYPRGPLQMLDDAGPAQRHRRPRGHARGNRRPRLHPRTPARRIRHRRNPIPQLTSPHAGIRSAHTGIRSAPHGIRSANSEATSARSRLFASLLAVRKTKQWPFGRLKNPFLSRTNHICGFLPDRAAVPGRAPMHPEIPASPPPGRKGRWSRG